MDPWEEPVWQDSLDCTQLGAETCDDNEILLLYELITCITSGWFVKKECSGKTCELQFIHIFHDIQQLIIYHTSWTLSVSMSNARWRIQDGKTGEESVSNSEAVDDTIDWLMVTQVWSESSVAPLLQSLYHHLCYQQCLLWAETHIQHCLVFSQQCFTNIIEYIMLSGWSFMCFFVKTSELI